MVKNIGWKNGGKHISDSSRQRKNFIERITLPAVVGRRCHNHETSTRRRKHAASFLRGTNGTIVLYTVRRLCPNHDISTRRRKRTACFFHGTIEHQLHNPAHLPSTTSDRRSVVSLCPARTLTATPRSWRCDAVLTNALPCTKNTKQSHADASVDLWASNFVECLTCTQISTDPSHRVT